MIHRLLRERLHRAAGLPLFDFDELRASEWSPVFESLIRRRLIMGLTTNLPPLWNTETSRARITANHQPIHFMQISIYDHDGIKFEAQASPDGPGGINHNNLAITSEGSTIRMWLTKDQCNALRRELDKLYPPPEQGSGRGPLL